MENSNYEAPHAIVDSVKLLPPLVPNIVLSILFSKTRTLDLCPSFLPVERSNQTHAEKVKLYFVTFVLTAMNWTCSRATLHNHLLPILICVNIINTDQRLVRL